MAASLASKLGIIAWLSTSQTTSVQRGTSQSSGVNPCPAELWGQDHHFREPRRWDPCPSESRRWGTGTCPCGAWRTEFMNFAWLGFESTRACPLSFFPISPFWIRNVYPMPVPPRYFGSSYLVSSSRLTVEEEFCLRTNLFF